MAARTRQRVGIVAALSSAILLGMNPVLGRWAILAGFSPLLVVAIRTGMAALLMLVYLLLFRRQFFYIFPVGLFGCFLAGALNGFGSLLYYQALGSLPASLGQLLYSLYPLFVALFTFLDKQPVSRLTILRVGIAAVAVFLLTRADGASAPLPAVLMMLGAAVLYALHIPINQRVLYEIPAPTVTLYTLLSMSLVTMPFYLIFDRSLPHPDASDAHHPAHAGHVCFAADAVSGHQEHRRLAGRSAGAGRIVHHHSAGLHAPERNAHSTANRWRGHSGSQHVAGGAGKTRPHAPSPQGRAGWPGCTRRKSSPGVCRIDKKRPTRSGMGRLFTAGQASRSFTSPTAKPADGLRTAAHHQQEFPWF